MVRYNVYNYKKTVCMVRYNVYNYKRLYVWFAIMYIIIKDCMYGSS